MRLRTFVLLGVLLLASRTAYADDPVWRAQTSETTENLTGVSFGSATTGLAVGSGATILRSTDGGIRWSKVTGISGLSSSACCSKARFFNSTVAWLAGSGTMMRSGSSGSGWFGFSYGSDTRRAIAPVSSDTAWITGNSSSGGRKFWRHKIEGNNSNVSSWAHAATDTMYGIDFVDADNGWAVGSPGRIVKITSATAGSPVFTNQTSGTTATLRGIDMIDANNGWVVGDGGAILHTTNGGTTWSPQSSGTVNGLRGVSFRNATEGIAVGTAGLILSTANGGATWTPEASSVSADLADVHHGAVTVAVGAAGTIVRRTTSPGGCDFSLNPTYGLWGSSGGTGTFNVTTSPGCAWTAVAADAWLTITAGASGSGNGTVSFSIGANGSSSAREGHITVGGQSYTVTQYGTSGGCPFTLSPNASFSRGGGSGTLSITTLTGCFWGLFADAAWITVDAPTTGFGSGSATYQVGANDTGVARSGTIFLAGHNISVTISQSAEGPARRRSVRH